MEPVQQVRHSLVAGLGGNGIAVVSDGDLLAGSELHLIAALTAGEVHQLRGHLSRLDFLLVQHDGGVLRAGEDIHGAGMVGEDPAGAGDGRQHKELQAEPGLEAQQFFSKSMDVQIRYLLRKGLPCQFALVLEGLYLGRSCRKNKL